MKLKLSCALLALSLPLFAQKATDVLDRAAKEIRDGGTIYAKFHVTQFSGTTETADEEGELWMSGQCFKMVTPAVTTWCDGQTLWSMLEGSGEVNMIAPDESDLLTTSPYHFLEAYKKGFRASVKKGELRGQDVYTVTLKAKDKNAQPSVVMLDVTQDTHRLLCIRAKNNGDWTRIALRTYQPHSNTAANVFRFNPADYPGVEIIDLR